MQAGQGQDELLTEINVVPLVDIVLVLLIIFMVTATFIVKPAIDMELPKADTGDRKERNQFSLLLGKDGSIAIGDRVVEEASISDEFAALFNKFKEEKRQSLLAEGKTPSDDLLEDMARRDLTMVIQADARVTHGRVIHFIDEARKVGILKYAFNVDPDAAESEADRTSQDAQDAEDKKVPTAP
ncbi:MAG: biopolymer transporter ExbD [Myxococcales bacterium]|nr:MAG: biopolymer transporter ExbD [Myxococcales bacterium]